MTDELADAVNKLVTERLIDAEQTGPIYRLCKLFKEGGQLPNDELERWKSLGYIMEHENGSLSFEMEDGDEPLNWALMGQAWSGLLKREKINGEWMYKLTPLGRERAEEIIKRLHRDAAHNRDDMI